MKAFLAQFKVWFLVVVIFVPAIFALPNPLSWEPFRYKEVSFKVDLTNGSPKEKNTLPVPNKAEAVGKSLFSSLLGIETEDMPTYVNLGNTSTVIYSGGNIVSSDLFLGEGGLADIYINLNEDGADSPIKIPLASSTYQSIAAIKGAGLGNQIVWQVKPTQQLENVIFSMTLKIGFEFKFGTYIKNYLILLAGWVILLASFIQVAQFLKRNENGSISFMDNTNKEILEYLTEKDVASEAAVINETFKGLDISKEEYVHRLKALQIKGFIRYERPFGNGAFIYITEEGRQAIKPFAHKTQEYITKHFLEILIFITAVLTLWVTLK